MDANKRDHGEAIFCSWLVLQFILLVLKLAGGIDWGWFWVFLPSVLTFGTDLILAMWHYYRS